MDQAMKLIIDITSENSKTSYDVASIPAFTDGKENIITMGEMSKAQAKQMFDHAMELMGRYAPGDIGSLNASEILGRLEDLYPVWTEEFESAL